MTVSVDIQRTRNTVNRIKEGVWSTSWNEVVIDNESASTYSSQAAQDRKERKEMYQKIMVPLDGSELAETVLPHVDAFIKGFHVKDVILARVVEPARRSYGGEAVLYPENLEEWEASRKSSAKEYLDQIAERFKHAETAVRCEVLFGSATESLVDYAEKGGIDLFIIATHGRSGVTRWVMGSVADKLLRSASVPVLMIRAPGAKGEI